MAIIGYARVSTDGQTLDSEIAALKGAGAARIYRETASGAKAERRELGRALKSMTAGDTLLVTRLDRLARSTRGLDQHSARSLSQVRAANEDDVCRFIDGA